jgi:hypothetical protein
LGSPRPAFGVRVRKWLSSQRTHHLQTSYQSMTVANDILEWSTDRPAWQRDALRRIAIAEALSVRDLIELVSLAKLERGLASPAAALPEPLNEDHLPTRATARTISLSAIADVEHVNALAPGQMLSFSAPGMTVIYGDNGVGKSGYVRILKKALRARGRDAPILSNVFGGPVEGEAKARINYQANEEEAVFEWSATSPAPVELSAASVFDSTSASVYCTSEQTVAYVPFGLDLLPKLADVCGRVRDELHAELAADIRRLESLPTELRETPSGIWFAALSRATSTEEIQERTSFSAVDIDERRRLAALLAEANPLERAAELGLKARRYEQLRSALHKLTTEITSASISALASAHRALEAAEARSERLLDAIQADSLLPGVESDEWSALWAAVLAYEAEISATRGDSNRLCPVCQQEVSETASGRMSHTRELFLATAKKLEAESRRNVELLAAPFQMPPAENRFDDVVGELMLDDSVLGEAALTALALSQSICSQVQVATVAGNWEEVVQATPSFKIELIDAVLLRLTTEISDLKKAASPAENRLLTQQVAELNAKEWLSRRVASITAEVDRLDRTSRLDSAIRDGRTTAITRKATELTREYVTEGLRAVFVRELDRVSATTPRMELVARPGERGKSFYRLELAGAPADTDVVAVISEGELRAVSLAAFLSELSAEDSGSCVVFDDPVSSQDIWNREKVATRLAQLAVERQVVIFTHDVFFLVNVVDEAARAGIACRTASLEKTANGAGVVIGDAPWEAKKFTSIMGALRDAFARAPGVASDPDVYRRVLSSLCTEFRKAIERAVEEVLLDDVVGRYRRQLFVSKVPKLARISQDDVDLIDRLMTKYSAFEHAQVPASRVPLPSLEELIADVAELANWARVFRDGK